MTDALSTIQQCDASTSWTIERVDPCEHIMLHHPDVARRVSDTRYALIGGDALIWSWQEGWHVSHTAPQPMTAPAHPIHCDVTSGYALVLVTTLAITAILRRWRSRR